MDGSNVYFFSEIIVQTCVLYIHNIYIYIHISYSEKEKKIIGNVWILSLQQIQRR